MRLGRAPLTGEVRRALTRPVSARSHIDPGAQSDDGENFELILLFVALAKYVERIARLGDCLFRSCAPKHRHAIAHAVDVHVMDFPVGTRALFHALDHCSMVQRSPHAEKQNAESDVARLTRISLGSIRATVATQQSKSPPVPVAGRRRASASRSSRTSNQILYVS